MINVDTSIRDIQCTTYQHTDRLDFSCALTLEILMTLFGSKDVESDIRVIRDVVNAKSVEMLMFQFNSNPLFSSYLMISVLLK